MYKIQSDWILIPRSFRQENFFITFDVVTNSEQDQRFLNDYFDCAPLIVIRNSHTYSISSKFKLPKDSSVILSLCPTITLGIHYQENIIVDE